MPKSVAVPKVPPVPTNEYLAFVWKDDPGQKGDGVYKMTACFHLRKVHVPFSFNAHSENDYLEFVGMAVACDGSCKSTTGSMEDFGQEPHHTSYDTKPILEAVDAFKS